MRVPAERAAALRALGAIACALLAATLVACRGSDSANAVVADAGTATAAHPSPPRTCTEGELACADDGRAIERCVDAGHVTATTCRGPGGCRARDAGQEPSCDDSIAAPDDPCDREGQIACSEDRRVELRCAGARFRFARECQKPCEARDGDLFCD